MTELFSGQDKEDRQQFLQAFKRGLAAGGATTPEVKAEYIWYFPMCLEPGSQVEYWYHRLPAAVQASWDLLEAAF
jgi:hypothetical protein